MAKLTIMEALEQSLVRVKQYVDEALENNNKVVVLTQDEYDALTDDEKSSDTLYVIK